MILMSNRAVATDSLRMRSSDGLASLERPSDQDHHLASASSPHHD